MESLLDVALVRFGGPATGRHPRFDVLYTASRAGDRLHRIDLVSSFTLQPT